MSVEAQADALAFYQTAMHDEHEREAALLGVGKPSSSPSRPAKPQAKKAKGGKR